MTDAQNESNGRAEIQVFALGGFQTNCMIVTDGPPDKGKGCLIVDCGYEPEDLLDAVESPQRTPARLVQPQATVLVLADAAAAADLAAPG